MKPSKVVKGEMCVKVCEGGRADVVQLSVVFDRQESSIVKETRQPYDPTGRARETCGDSDPLSKLDDKSGSKQKVQSSKTRGRVFAGPGPARRGGE